MQNWKIKNKIQDENHALEPGEVEDCNAEWQKVNLVNVHDGALIALFLALQCPWWSIDRALHRYKRLVCRVHWFSYCFWPRSSHLFNKVRAAQPVVKRVDCLLCFWLSFLSCSTFEDNNDWFSYFLHALPQLFDWSRTLESWPKVSNELIMQVIPALYGSFG
jgi:hypothetical protein